MSERGISKNWVVISYIVFISSELFLGGFVAKIIEGKFVGHVAHFRLEAILILSSYLIGGFIVGLLSPRVRVTEPAIGAALAVVTTFLITFFSPFSFLTFKSVRVLIGGVIAFFLALAGARAGEKTSAFFGNEKSKDYVDKL